MIAIDVFEKAAQCTLYKEVYRTSLNVEGEHLKGCGVVDVFLQKLLKIEVLCGVVDKHGSLKVNGGCCVCVLLVGRL